MDADARRGQTGERVVCFDTTNEPGETRNKADGAIFSVFMVL